MIQLRGTILQDSAIRQERRVESGPLEATPDGMAIERLVSTGGDGGEVVVATLLGTFFEDAPRLPAGSPVRAWWRSTAITTPST